MFQIASGRFFGGAQRFDAAGRGVLFAQAPLTRAVCAAGVTLSPSSDESTAWRRIEVVYHNGLPVPDGGPRPGTHISTGGDVIVEQVRVLTQVATQTLVCPEPESLKRIGRLHERNSWPLPAMMSSLELDAQDVEQFLTQASHLPRETFLKAISSATAIDRAVRAAEYSYDAAFALAVFAIEALVPEPTERPSWSDMPSDERRAFERVLAAVDVADPAAGTAIRDVILDGRHFQLFIRFRDLVTTTAGSALFEKGVVRRSDIERVLRNAYQVRSRYVHKLVESRKPHVPSLSRHVTWHEGEPYLSLQGIVCVASEVVCALVRRGPHSHTESGVKWNEQLPGVSRVQLSHEYWLGKAAAFSPRHVARQFSECMVHCSLLWSGRVQKLVDLRPGLQAASEHFPNYKKEDKRRILAIFFLWRCFAPPDAQLPRVTELLEAGASAFDAASIESMVVHLLDGQELPWSSTECLNVWRTYEASRYGPNKVRLPVLVESGVRAAIANRLLAEGQVAAFTDLCVQIADDEGERPPLREVVLSACRQPTPLDVDSILGLRRISRDVPDSAR